MTRDNPKTMAFGRVNAFVITVHREEAPTDAEWNQYLDFWEATGLINGTIARLLVVTRGGAPTATQRKRLHDHVSEALRRNPLGVKGAIVTPSTFVRGIVNAMSLINPIYRAFPPADIARAYEYIGIPPGYIGEVEHMIASLEAELGLRVEPSPPPAT